MPSEDWWPWYEEALDALLATVEAADVEWATTATGDPWIIPAQRRPPGIGYPHAMVLRFVKRRDEAESTKRDELLRIDTSVSVFREGDSNKPEENFRQAMEDMAEIETALYNDRSLGGVCKNVVIDQADPFSLENANGTTETVGDIQLTITKTADHSQ